MQALINISYAAVGEHDLLLDLFLPETENKPNVIIWLHGGAWSTGSKNDVHILDMVDKGFALASIDFRPSSEATFPAQIYDIKAAIRFLRAHAAKYNYDESNITLWGYSSGGHLATLTGVTNTKAEFEGDLGEFLGYSSAVQAVVDVSGPANLQSILQQSTPHGLSVRVPALEQLFGKGIDNSTMRDSLRLASPVAQADKASPPLFILHGMQDNQVPINQSLELHEVYLRHALQVEVEWLVDADHGSMDYFKSPYLEKVTAFLNKLF